MSETMRLQKALLRAVAMVRMLSDVAQTYIAGSIRRGKPNVKDCELVAIRSYDLLARLDKLLLAGKIEKARYGENGSYRWGDRYRGFVYRGLTIELFMTDEHSFGYIYWLRTGPGDANQYAVTQMRAAPYDLREGAVWWGNQRISVPDEREMLRLMGIPVWIEPQYRGIDVYRRYMSNPRWADRESLSLLPPVPQQGSLL